MNLNYFYQNYEMKINNMENIYVTICVNSFCCIRPIKKMNYFCEKGYDLYDEISGHI